MTSGLVVSTGSQDSQRGSHQVRSPSTVSTDGSRTARTTVASSRIATARPTPSCLKVVIDSVAKTANTATMITAALVTTPAEILMPCATASRVDSPRSCASRIRDTTNTW